MSSRPAPDRLLLLLAYLGFVSLGLPDAVLGMVWPSIRDTFALPQAALGGPLAAAASGYFLSGLLAGRLVHTLGIGGLLTVSTALVTLGVAGYALATSALTFMAAALLVGWGSGAVDTGLNTYAAQRFAPRHMTWLHAAYSAGAALGSLTMLPFVGARWRYGYAVVALALALLCAGFFVSRQRWSLRGAESTPTEKAGKLGGLAALRQRRVQLQALLFFVYSGLEFGIGSWAYTILTQGRGLDPRSAAALVTAYWTSLLLGRVLSGFVVERVGNVPLVRVGTASAAVGAVLFALPMAPLFLSALGLGLVGLAIAPVYPGLMSETPRRVGAEAAPHAVGFQVSAATAGAVALPTLGGALATSFGLALTAALMASAALLLFALHELLVASTRARARA